MNKYIITKKIEDFAPPETQEKWDCSGWAVETDKTNVNKIMLCLTVTDDIIKQAIEKNCDMVISHHPLFLVNCHSELVSESLKPKIDVYCAHTNMDKARGGTTDRLIEALYQKSGGQKDKRAGYFHVKNLFPYSTISLFPSNANNDFLRYITCDIPINVFLLILRQISPNLRYVNNKGVETLHKIAFCAGSGSEFIKEAYENGADAFVTGDVKFHTALESPIVLFDIGHFESEILILDVFEKLIGNEVEIIRAKEQSPFICHI